MTHERTISRYRRGYRALLGLYPTTYRERFAEGMEQTFTDLCRDRAASEKSLPVFAARLFIEASIGIINEQARDNATQRTLLRIALATSGILLIPLLGNLFMGWSWPPLAFVGAGLILFSLGLAGALIARMGNHMSHGSHLPYRAAFAIACLTGLILLFINAAAGIIGDGPINLMYLGVLATAFLGAVLARFRPRGMAFTLLATAAAQILIPLIALIIWKTAGPSLLTDPGSPHPPFHPGILQVFGLNAVFAASWLVSAFLFRRAGDRGPGTRLRPRVPEHRASPAA